MARGSTLARLYMLVVLFPYRLILIGSQQGVG